MSTLASIWREAHAPEVRAAPKLALSSRPRRTRQELAAHDFVIAAYVARAIARRKAKKEG